LQPTQPTLKSSATITINPGPVELAKDATREIVKEPPKEEEVKEKPKPRLVIKKKTSPVKTEEKISPEKQEEPKVYFISCNYNYVFSNPDITIHVNLL
jgi:hypothetical protein